MDKKKELEILLRQLEERKKSFGIVDFRPVLTEQRELIDSVAKRTFKFYGYFGGNGAGKTAISAYIVAKLSLGYAGCEKYGLSPIGEKKLIWIGTKSGANVQSTIEPYLLGEGSITRIPEEEIQNKHYDNQILKSIELKNGCVIKMFTYDQGRERVQGGNPDFIWMDEEPVDDSIWKEILARSRNKDCEILISMTPLSGMTPVYEFFFENTSELLKQKVVSWFVDARDNPTTDKTWMEGLTEEEILSRVLGQFTNASGQVFHHFSRQRNTVEHIEPTAQNLGEGVRYYRSIDFGTSHPTAALFIAVDADENVYVFDEIYESNMLLEDLKRKLDEKSKGLDIEYTLGDSAAKRERFELQRLGITTVPADKHSKGENEMSNRRAGIMKVNNMLYNGKLVISRNCPQLIREFEKHFYKEGAKKDGEVIKTDDDALDALRYFIFSYKKQKSETKKENEFERKWKEKQKQFILQDKFNENGQIQRKRFF